MAYQWPLDPATLFAERYPRMVNTGLPKEVVDRTRNLISDMWANEPGGWVYEWSRLASDYASQGRHDLATLAYGWAKFPTLTDDAKRTAFAKQLEEYAAAGAGFPLAVDRTLLTLRPSGAECTLPVHILKKRDATAAAPILLASGGVDSWKVDHHGLFATLATAIPVQVLAFDIPGTGEAPIPMNAQSVALLDELVAAARTMGNGKVFHLGISMGGYYSAYTGLSGTVDGAVVLGGPVDAAFAHDRRWAFGMADIVGNAVGFDRKPTDDELADATAQMSLRRLLDVDTNAPMLVLNGADDVHVPQHDTTVFEGRRDTIAELIPNAGHCAVTRLDYVLPRIIDWITSQITSQEHVSHWQRN